MRTTLSLLSFLLTASFAQSQDHCDYNAQIPIDMGAGSTTDKAIALLQQSDGKLIGVGSTYYIGSNHFEASLFRLNLDLTFDQTFGVNGRIGHTWDQRNTVNCAMITEEDKVLVGGYQAPSNGISGFRGYVARIDIDGTADEDFAESGSFKFDLMPGTESVVVGINELIFLEEGMESTENIAGPIRAAYISREPFGFGTFLLDENGALDTSYGSQGYVHHSVSDVTWQTDYGEAHFQSNDHVIIVGKVLENSIVHPFVARIQPDGAMDPDFGDQGILRLTDTIPYNNAGIHATLDQNDDILLSYTNNSSPKYYHLTKVDGQDGSIVTGFGTDGKVVSTESGSFNQPCDVLTDPWTGMIYSIGEGSSSNRFPTIWTVDADGNEVDQCGGGATFINAMEQSQGYHAGLFDFNGDLRLLGETGLTDTTSGDNQSFNMMVPTIATPSSTREEDQVSIGLYPNPTAGLLTIQLERHGLADYRIVDAKGAIVDMGTTNGQVDVARLESGLYSIAVFTQDGRMGSRSFVRE